MSVLFPFRFREDNRLPVDYASSGVPDPRGSINVARVQTKDVYEEQLVEADFSGLTAIIAVQISLFATFGSLWSLQSAADIPVARLDESRISTIRIGVKNSSPGVIPVVDGQRQIANEPITDAERLHGGTINFQEIFLIQRCPTAWKEIWYGSPTSHHSSLCAERWET
jgi:hypothetical protein